VKLLGERNLLFLDEAIQSGRERPDSPDYPPLTVEERRVLKVVANGLFISESAITWAFYNAQRGDKNAFRKIIGILGAKPLKPIMRA
jgi:hypothetical protein